MENYLSVNEDIPYYNYINYSCEDNIVPSAAEYITSLGAFGAIFVSIGTILTMTTIVLTGITCYQVLLQREQIKYKKNCLLILSIYPIASTCSLIALSIPRTQLLSQAVTQVALTISMYRLYLLIIDIGRRKVTKITTTAMAMAMTTPTTTTTPMLLKVGPCCCWPCLPFPNLQLNDANLSWLRIIVLQFPIVQGILYIIYLVMFMENPMIYAKTQVFLQPFNIASVLFALYGVNVAFMSFKNVNPEANLRLKVIVTQLVLFFSNVQAFIIRYLPATGLFPCNPPITPILYANLTYNALMLIEMLLLCYAARYLYTNDYDKQQRHHGELPSISMINVQSLRKNKVKTELSVDINLQNFNNNNKRKNNDN